MFRSSIKIIVFLQLSVLSLQAQEVPFVVFGEFWDRDSEILLPGGQVRAVDENDSTLVITTKADGKGRYLLELPFDHVFIVQYSAPGYIGRSFRFDLNGVPQKKRNGDHGIDVQAPLIRPIEGVDYSVYSEVPFGHCRLNAKGRRFEWDQEHAAANEELFRSVIEQHDSRRKELGM